jgi:hypothetical protein
VTQFRTRIDRSVTAMKRSSRIGLISQHVVEPLNLRSQVRRSEAKQEHASVRAPESNDELTKIEIAGDQNSLLVVSDREDVLI